MKKYKPRDHGENRMKHEGDVMLARNNFLKRKNKNLEFLLYNRFNWMNKYIKKNDVGIEVGCGTGISKNYIHNGTFYLTDYADHDFLDYKMIDALDTNFEDNSYDFIISSNMIHHVPFPSKFFNEMKRILKPGGKLIIQEINCSFVMRYLLKLMRHEGYDFEIDVFNHNLICTDPHDLWSANCAIPNLLFDDDIKFEKKFPYFTILHKSHSEFINFINSGGVISKTIHIPLPNFILKILGKIDSILTSRFSKTFALQRQIVLQKK
jgi:SAM-dependent methyltransferase